MILFGSRHHHHHHLRHPDVDAHHTRANGCESHEHHTLSLRNAHAPPFKSRTNAHCTYRLLICSGPVFSVCPPHALCVLCDHHHRHHTFLTRVHVYSKKIIRPKRRRCNPCQRCRPHKSCHCSTLNLRTRWPRTRRSHRSRKHSWRRCRTYKTPRRLLTDTVTRRSRTTRPRTWPAPPPASPRSAWRPRSHPTRRHT